jgi:hypothetical protein
MTNPIESISNASGKIYDTIGGAVRGVLDIPVTPLTKFLQSISRSTTDKNQSDLPDYSKTALFGMPPRFIDNADPNQRVYVNTFLADAPIVSLMPGRPEFLGITNDGQGTSKDGKDLFELLTGLSDEDSNKNERETLSRTNQKSLTDLRYYGFKSEMTEYLSYVRTLSTNLYSKMGLGTVFDMEEYIDINLSKGSFFSFYVDRSTSITEDASNETGSTMLEGLTKKASGIINELKFLLGKDISADNISDIENDPNLNQEIKDQAKALSDPNMFREFLSIGGVEKINTITNGSKLLYPEIWQDSKFSKNIQISVKLYSPYGDPGSIFKYIYFPFILLMAFTLPRHDTFMGYASPFLVKVDSPGWLTCDMGIVTSLTYKKGGNEDLWSKDGLPLEMDVTLSVKDLYPVLMMSNRFSRLAVNHALHGFLNNLAGIGAVEIVGPAGIIARFATKLNMIYNIDTFLESKVVDFRTRVLSGDNFLAKLLGGR